MSLDALAATSDASSCGDCISDSSMVEIEKMKKGIDQLVVERMRAAPTKAPREVIEAVKTPLNERPKKAH